MSEHSQKPLKLVVIFNDPFPDDVLNLLAQSAKKIIADHFTAALKKDNARKPYAYPAQDDFELHHDFVLSLPVEKRIKTQRF